MRTSTLTAVAAILMISSIVSGQYNYNNLSVNDPQRTFWYYTMKGSITEASLNIKPHGTYLEYDLYLTLKATVKKYDYSWYNNNTNITSCLLYTSKCDP